MSLARVRTGIDSWVSDSAPSTNHGGGKWLWLQAPGTATTDSFVFFKNPAPRGATILSATLKLFGAGASGASYTVNVQRVAAKWIESQINYNNAPGVTGSVVSVTQTQSVDALEWDFDVTALLQTITDGAANYGFRLSTTDTTARKFYSLNALDNHPYLEVEWSDAPDAPTELSPSAGSAVSIAKPVLTFNFHDVSGLTAMAGCQVQINPTNSFTSPAFDSGTVSTSDPELDLSTTAYAGIAVGDTAWWRVRVEDAAGLWSDWSQSRYFTRTAKGTLTINSPTGGTISDVTQTILWTLSGATQTAYRITLWDDSDPGIPIYDSGRRASTASSFTLPASALLSNGVGTIINESTVYRLRVRVWDTTTRVATPGDAAHTEAVTTFSFVEDPTPNAPTGLTATQVGASPRVQLDFSRSTAPDYFAIQRDGKWIDTDLDPADLLVSGTAYRYIDRTAEPGSSHTWKVRAKVGGVLGPAATVTGSFDVSAIWLCDTDTPSSGKLVRIRWTGNDSHQFDMPETAAIFTPVNGRAVSRIVQAQRGLEGTISGLILDGDGATAETYTSNLLWMKKHPNHVFRLTLGEQNLNVILGNIVVAPVAGYQDGGARQVTMQFWSQDGVTA